MLCKGLLMIRHDAVACHVMSHHVTSVMSCPVMSCIAKPYSCHVLPNHAKPCHVTSHHAKSCHIMLCRVMSCHITSCHITSRHAMLVFTPLLVTVYWQAFRSCGHIGSMSLCCYFDTDKSRPWSMHKPQHPN